LKKRGPIEAVSGGDGIHHGAVSPRLKKRGPIEALASSRISFFSVYSPRLKKRGPIEAGCVLSMAEGG